MPTSQNAALQHLIERQIQQRTWGRVYQLEVDVDDERIRVRGWTTSYYTKQLTIQAILDSVGVQPALRIDVDLEVGESMPAVVSGGSRRLTSPA